MRHTFSILVEVEVTGADRASVVELADRMQQEVDMVVDDVIFDQPEGKYGGVMHTTERKEIET